MVSKENQFHTPDNDYSHRVINRLKSLEPESVVLFDVDDTAVISNKKGKRVRKDFDQVQGWLKNNRPDLRKGLITFRSRQTGVDELGDYDFENAWYIEDIVECVGKPSKIDFLKGVFKNSIKKLLLIDDSPEGDIAEAEGFGIKIQ